MDRPRSMFVRRALIGGILALGVGTAGLAGVAQAHGRSGAYAQRHAALERLKQELKLTAAQQQAWQAIAAKQRALWQQRREGWKEVRHALEAQLAVPEPDLAQVAAVRERVREREHAAREQIEHRRLELYASFSPEQKGVMRDFLKTRLAQAEQRMHHRGRYHERRERPAPPGASS